MELASHQGCHGKFEEEQATQVDRRHTDKVDVDRGKEVDSEEVEQIFRE
jgi:hypothetical protein